MSFPDIKVRECKKGKESIWIFEGEFSGYGFDTDGDAHQAIQLMAMWYHRGIEDGTPHGFVDPRKKFPELQWVDGAAIGDVAVATNAPIRIGTMRKILESGVTETVFVVSCDPTISNFEHADLPSAKIHAQKIADALWWVNLLPLSSPTG